MDTVEIVVYLSIALLIGGLVLLATARIGTSNIYEKIRGIFTDDEIKEFTQVNNDTLAPLLFSTWEKCGLGTVPINITFQYTDTVPTGKGEIFQKIKAMRLCRTLSSLSEGCGLREDLSLIGQIEPGRVYTASCDPVLEQLVIT